MEPEFETATEVPVKQEGAAIPVSAITRVETTDLQRLEQEVKNYKRVLGLAIGMTNSRDWVDHGGDAPFLEASGAEKIAVPFGISFGPVSDIKCEQRTDKNGAYFIFTAHYFAEWRGKRAEYIGRSSSRGEFFSRGGKLDIEEISIPNLMAQAQTNALSNCIKRVLGIRNLTWDELAQFGIKRGDAKSIKYKVKNDQAQTGAGAKQAHAKGEPMGSWEYKGTVYVFALVPPFDVEFLKGLNMVESKKEAGKWFTSKDVEGTKAELVKMLEFLNTPEKK